MKKIICIKGEKDKGKTSTIAMLYQYFVDNAFIPQVGTATQSFKGAFLCDESYDDRNKIENFIAILPVCSHTIGFISAGDPGTDLCKKVDLMLKMDVDIVICAVRVGNQGTKDNSVNEEFTTKINQEIVIEHNVNEYPVDGLDGVFTSKAKLFLTIKNEIIDILDIELPNDNSKLINLDVIKQQIEEVSKH